MGLKSTDLKLLTAIVVAAALALPVLKLRLPKKKQVLPQEAK